MEAIDQIEGDDSYLDYLDILLGPADSLTNSICSSGGVVDIDFSSSVGVVTQVKECLRKRGRSDSCSGAGTKACHEKLRRERLNDRFQDLSSVLEPGRPAKTDKPAILDDAIRVLNQLKNEAQELKETNEKLLEEIKSLKAEKTELREEKLMLKADKEKMEQQLKTLALTTSGFMPAYPATYHAAANKIPVFPGYGLMPMWHYLPPATCDTSRDHELRPPAA
ncbi:PREDICTED: transcription factor bHLH104-like [Populus euphratica]|uniref:Transcription factor bHLH104-like n=1 Tax=Populus euphratica TaxID=75702 RepID=A0AAJ6UJR3_POPEU|nr:PREDICTED: transcription factor bHLH104-like [Populus euphratica]